MGTRNLVLVYYKGTYQIAQYGQWDGYPSGQGVIVLAFVSDPANLIKLKDALDTPGRLFEPSSTQLDNWIKEMNQQFNDHYNSGVVGEGWPSKPSPRYPSISRDTGAGVLKLVADAMDPVPIVKEVEFIADTLFCEWAYVVDLDAGVLEVYSGVRDGDVQERFGVKEGVRPGGRPSLLGEWKLDALPSEAELLRLN